MSAKGEILFLSHRMPYPPDKGDKIRSWRLFRLLTERFQVHLGCFVDDPDDFKYRNFLSSYTRSSAFIPLTPALARLKSVCALSSGTPLSFAYFNDPRMRAYVNETRRSTLVAEIAFSSSMAPYIAKGVPNRPRLLDFCDADSEKWRQYAKRCNTPMRWIYETEADRLARAETQAVNWADATFAISPEEAEIFNARPDVQRPVHWFGNGVDSEFFAPGAQAVANRNAASVVFVGAMDYEANVEAVLWFSRRVWHSVRREWPKAQFSIVGRNPDRRVRALAGVPGITVTGKVDDVRGYLNEASVVAAPLQVARGVQNKVLEAMAMSRPVVASSGANAGINAVPGEEIIIADSPGAFSDAVRRLLANPAEGDAIGARARNRIVADFSWPAQLSNFDKALDAAGL